MNDLHTTTTDEFHRRELRKHRRVVHGLMSIWDVRNTSSGIFDKVKKSGKVFKGVKREN